MDYESLFNRIVGEKPKKKKASARCSTLTELYACESQKEFLDALESNECLAEAFRERFAVYDGWLAALSDEELTKGVAPEEFEREELYTIFKAYRTLCDIRIKCMVVLFSFMITSKKKEHTTITPAQIRDVYREYIGSDMYVYSACMSFSVMKFEDGEPPIEKIAHEIFDAFEKGNEEMLASYTVAFLMTRDPVLATQVRGMVSDVFEAYTADTERYFDGSNESASEVLEWVLPLFAAMEPADYEYSAQKLALLYQDGLVDL